jgi:glutathione synthase/RimK-type ligase-like ATP-grasp enzyme
MLVQAFVEEIEHGEYSLVFFDNRYSHAVLKTPAPRDFRVQLDHGGTHGAVDPPPGVVEQGERVLAATGGSHAYARVDLVVAGGQCLLMELELIDPVLFFGFAGRAATARFVEAMQSLSGNVACVP